MIFFFVFISFLIIQRLTELIIAGKNERYALSRGAVEYDSKGYKYIVIMHTSFFVSLIVKFIFFRQVLNNYWYIFFSVFLAAQVLRYWAITSLGVHWNTKILVIPGTMLIDKGPYKYLKHPNYIAVITELAVIPLIFSCYFTSAVFTVLNILVLSRRIKMEEEALSRNALKNINQVLQ